MVSSDSASAVKERGSRAQEKGSAGREGDSFNVGRAYGGPRRGSGQGRAVRRYLEALEATRPRRGRKRTPEGIAKRLVAIDERMAAADALSRLQLAQQRMDLEAERTASGAGGVDMDALEAAFIQAAGPYSQRKGISYNAWRAAGSSPEC